MSACQTIHSLRVRAKRTSCSNMRRRICARPVSTPIRTRAIEAWEQWLNGQRYTFLTEVNVGSWGTDLRKMAEEAGLIELHRNDYARWSSTTHSMWHHVACFNLQYCTNPLHGHHRVPVQSLNCRLCPNCYCVLRNTWICLFASSMRLQRQT